MYILCQRSVNLFVDYSTRFAPLPSPHVLDRHIPFQLLDIARCAKESEAAVLKEAYKRRASKQAGNLAINGGAACGDNEIWRIPPPAVDAKDEEVK